MATPGPKPPSKSARYRAKEKAEGETFRRIAPDYNAPGMRDEIARQVAFLHDSPGEKEVMAWLEAVTSDLQMDPYDWSDDAETKPET